MGVAMKTKTAATSAIATASKKKAAAASAAASAAGASSSSDDSDSGVESVTRAERSRRTARQGRQRKKQYIGELESKLMSTETRDVTLRDELEAAQRKLATLQAQHTTLLGNRTF